MTLRSETIDQMRREHWCKFDAEYCQTSKMMRTRETRKSKKREHPISIFSSFLAFGECS